MSLVKAKLEAVIFQDILLVTQANAIDTSVGKGYNIFGKNKKEPWEINLSIQ